MFYRSLKNGATGDDGKNLDGHISHEEYLTCQKIWDELCMNNMADYHDHYLKKDVLFLADVFEKFIDTSLKFYGIDPCHYFSSSGLSWDAMLKMTAVKLEKLSDPGKYLFIKKGLNGGLSYIAKRYAKANNKYMQNYNPKKPSKFIIYLDMNNLYGWAMSEYLPYEGFKWLKNVGGFDVMSFSKESKIGFILEVDLEYPDELHESHNYYPLAPEILAIPYEMLLDYCKKLADKYRIKVGNVKALIPNLGNKTNYVLYYRDLQWYLSLGMERFLKY